MENKVEVAEADPNPQTRSADERKIMPNLGWRRGVRARIASRDKTCLAASRQKLTCDPE